MRMLAENIDKLNFPDTVIGFKLTDRKPAETQLQRLEVLVGMMLRAA